MRLFSITFSLFLLLAGLQAQAGKQPYIKRLSLQDGDPEQVCLHVLNRGP